MAFKGKPYAIISGERVLFHIYVRSNQRGFANVARHDLITEDEIAANMGQGLLAKGHRQAAGSPTRNFNFEKHDRFPVRIRYARTSRDDEENIWRLLIRGGGMSSGPVAAGTSSIGGSPTEEAPTPMEKPATKSRFESVNEDGHKATPPHVAKGSVLIRLDVVATVKIVEGPAMITSEMVGC